MITTRLIVSATLIAYCLAGLTAQKNSRLGTMPQLNLNVDFNDHWKGNFKAEFRQLLSRQTEDITFRGYRHVLSDLSFAASRRAGINSSLTLGYLLRLTSNESSHRLFQQYSLVRRYEGYRLGHRFAADQTFSTEKTKFRFRYRIAGDLALNGLSVDPREFYIKISAEILMAIEGNEEVPEYRLVPQLGFAISDQSKIEAGIDYRVDNFFSSHSRRSIWIRTGWYVSI